MKKSILLSIMLLFLSSHIVLGHGIRIETEMNAPFVTVKASFSPTSLTIDAQVDVFAPESTAPFQRGRTDTKGRFTFLPDVAGEWKVAIDDERGHKRTTSVQISAEFLNGNEEAIEAKKDIEADTLCAHAEYYHHKQHQHAHDGHIPLLYKIIFGLALIFGITGFFYGIKSKKVKD